MKLKKAVIIISLCLVGLFVISKIAGGIFKQRISETAASSPLYFAVAAQNSEKIREIVQNGGNVNERGLMGHSPLIMAVGVNNPDIAKFLLLSGASPDKKDDLGWTALHHAIKADSAKLNMIEILVQNGANINATDKHQRTPLHRAAQFGHVSAVKLLLKLGADKNAKDENGRTPTDRGQNHSDVTKVLQDN